MTQVKKLFYSRTDFEQDLIDITRQLAKANWKPDLILGPARGGLIPSVYLSHFYNVKMEPVNLSLRDFKTNLQKIKFEIENILQYNNILIIDDIVDSGETFKLLNEILVKYIEEEYKKTFVDGFPSFPLVSSIKFATCVFNEANEFKITPDFYARKINKAIDNVWIDFWFESFWRNIA